MRDESRGRALARRSSLAAAPAGGRAQLKIGGTTYTKWLWGNQRDDGSLYNFTTVPGEGYGDNGQGSEIELLRPRQGLGRRSR